MKQRISKAVALLLAVFMFATGFGGSTALPTADAALTYITAGMIDLPRSGDACYRLATNYWGHPAKNLMNGWHLESTNFTHVHCQVPSGTTFNGWGEEGQACYCAQPGGGRSIGDAYTLSGKYWTESWWSTKNKTLNYREIQKWLGRVLYLGYHGTINGSNWWSQSATQSPKIVHYIATQLLVWEVVVGERDNNFGHVSTGGADTVLSTIGSNHPLRTRIIQKYNEMVSALQAWEKIPSFMSEANATTIQSHFVHYDGSKYTVTLTDTNNVLSNFTFSSVAGVTFTKSGNKLTITASTDPRGITITAQNNNKKTDELLTYEGTYNTRQVTVTYGAEHKADPISAKMQLKVRDSELQISKTSSDGVIAGWEFTIKNKATGAYAQNSSGGTTFVTNAEGKITTGIKPGTYIVHEVPKEGYVVQPDQEVVLYDDETGVVRFHNVKDTIPLKIYKTSDNNVVDGFEFEITGGNLTAPLRYTTVFSHYGEGGKKYGLITAELEPGTYIVHEVPREGYVLQPDQEVTVVEGGENTVTFNNKPGYPYRIKKVSEDGNVAGIGFSIRGIANLNGEREVDVVLYTDENGEIDITLYAIPGKSSTSYGIREIVPEGYSVSNPTRIISISSSQDPTIVEELKFENTLQRGNLEVHKDSADNVKQGFRFHLYGTSTTGVEVDEYATTNAQGVVRFENIPVGNDYTLEEDTTNLPARYVAPAPVEGIKISANTTTTLSGQTEVFNDINIQLEIYKTSSNNQIEGWSFTVTGTDLNGNSVNITRTTDVAGLIKLGLRPGTYTVHENLTAEQLAAGWEQPADQTITLNPDDGSTSVFFYNENFVDVEIVKTSSNNVVEGFEFTFTDMSTGDLFADETGATVFSTDVNGKISLRVQPGTYTVHEVPKAGYKEQTDKTLTIVGNESLVTVDFHNEVKTGTLIINKTAYDNIVKGMQFRLYGTSTTGEAIDVTATTDAQGVARFEDIPVGDNYTVEEINTPARYVQPVAITGIEVKEGETITKAVLNKTKFPLHIIKTVPQNSNASADGWKFKIESVGKDSEGNTVSITKTTKKGGKIDVELWPGTYKVTEILTDAQIAAGWQQPEPQTKTITNDGVSFEFENERTVPFVIVKTSDSGVVSGFRFTIKNKATGEYVKNSENTTEETTFVTDADGIITMNLLPGTYVVHEDLTQAQLNDGYTQPDDQEVPVVGNEESVSVSFHNSKELSLTIKKRKSPNGVLSGWSFTVTSVEPNEAGETVDITAVTNNKGVIVKNLKPGKYRVHENLTDAQIADGYKQPDDQIVTLTNRNKTVSFDNKRDVPVKLVKTSSDNIVEGFEFTFTNTATGALVADATGATVFRTDGNGEISLRLDPGTYTVHEVPKVGYIEQSDKSLTVAGNEALVTIDFHNELETYLLHIIKTSASGVVDGFKFTITGTDVTGANVNITETTANGGKIDVELLPGEYTVTEILTDAQIADGYVQQSPKSVTINDGDETVEFYNDYFKLFKVVKTSSNNQVEGWAFRIESIGKDSAGKAVNITATTDADGVIARNLRPGTYKVTEVLTDAQIAAGWQQPEPQTKTITDSDVTVYFSNFINAGPCQIIKTSEDGVIAGIGFTIAGTSLAGAQVNRHEVTNASGMIEIDLDPGTYTVTEDSSDKYLPQDPQTVEVAAGQTTTVRFYNELKKVNLEIVKTSEDGNIEGIEFTVTGTTVLGDQFSETVTTNAEGKAELTNIMPGTYTVTESELDAYIPTDAQTVTLNPGESKSVEFYNELKRGTLEVIKTSEDGEVEGITFRLSGTSLSGAEVNLTAVTDANGKATFENVLIGDNYTVTEVDAPEKYIPVSPVAGVELAWEQTTTVRFYNELKKVNLEIVKTSEDGNIEGIEFTVTGTTVLGDQFSETVTTNAEGKAELTNIMPGTYTVTESELDAYIPTDAQTVTLNPGESKSVEFYNELKRGTLEVIKTSEDGEVEGITFRLSGTSLSGAEVNLTAVTDANGKATFENVLIGDNYTVTEENTPAKYIVPDPANDFDITWNETAKIVVENITKTGELRIVKTSEDGLVEGIEFTVESIEPNIEGKMVNMTLTTNRDGIISTQLKAGWYKITEAASDKYLPQDPQTVEVKPNETTEVTFINTLIRAELEIVKTSEDGKIEGVSFHVTGVTLARTSYDEIVSTDANGRILLTGLVPGTYTIVEEVIDVYEPNELQTVALIPGDSKTVTFTNTLKKGAIRIAKTSTDGIIGSLEFRLTGTSLSGAEVNRTAKTNSNGIAIFRNVPIGDNYTIEEINTPERYVQPVATNGIKVEWNREVRLSVENREKLFSVTVSKVDAETGTAQGDASLAGAIYGIYKGEELIDTYTTDASGMFTTKEYVCGDDWSIKEITPSEGYALDETSYHVGAEAGNFTVEHNPLNLTVNETVLTGKVSITKMAENRRTKPSSPEEGATFEVYLKSAGSYEAAKDSERDILVADKDGFAVSKDLPYGTYVIHQIVTWEGRILLEDTDVFVEGEAEPLQLSFTNAIEQYYVMVTKVDSETGKVIPYAGAGFQIYASDGELITIPAENPKLPEIDTFYTTEEGKLVTPDTIAFGRGYSLVEVKAPAGYVLDATPVYFDLTKADAETENNVSIVKVIKADKPQMGQIIVEKTGEVFASVNEADGEYKPVYEVRGLEGAIYKIVAAEDIITPDGTVRVTSGTEVDRITTGSDGKATSKELYLGKYIVTEVKAPAGMVLNTSSEAVELTYAGQEAEATLPTSFCNDRQRANILLQKAVEKDDLFGIGSGNEITSVAFGLYALDALTAEDGSVIPAGGLLGIATCAEDGSAAFDVDIPVGARLYVKEIATDEHYVMSNAEFAVVFDYAGQDVATVEILVNNGKAIDNRLIRGSVSGKKVDEDGVAVENATFGLFAKEETEFTTETAYIVTVTDADGLFSFENMPYGEYVIREIEPAEGFVLNETAYPIEIREDGQVVEITVENRHIVGSVQLTKVDEDYPENRLAGATFEVYKDVDGDGEFNPDVDALVGEMTEVEEGVYRMDDLRYGGYFVYEKTAPEGFNKDENFHFFKITTQDELVEVENEAGVGFIDVCITGSVQLTKVDEDYPENRLTGATFEVYKDVDGDGEFNPDVDALVGEMTEVEEGVYRMDDLRYGGYFVYEKTAPEGFNKDENFHFFKITTQDELVEVENEAGVGFINNCDRKTLRIVKTSEDNVIEGFKFEITGKDFMGNDVKVEAITDKDGIIEVELRSGEYTVTEVLEGENLRYVRPEPMTIEIKADEEEAVVVAVNNVLVPVPKTGDLSRPEMWYALCVTSLVGLCFTAYLAFRKKDEDKETVA